MKVNIWIKKEDVLSGKITEYHTHLPQVSYNSYVQVTISVDWFAQLEDNRLSPLEDNQRKSHIEEPKTFTQEKNDDYINPGGL